MQCRFGRTVGALLIAVPITACATRSQASASDRYRITAAELGSVDVSTVYDVVQRLRPLWLEVRGARGLQVETQVVVFLDRMFLGGVEELRRLGTESAEWLEYQTGSRAAGELTLPGDRHIEGAIIVHTAERSR